jgi:hypothetical protein
VAKKKADDQGQEQAQPTQASEKLYPPTPYPSEADAQTRIRHAHGDDSAVKRQG